MGAKVNLIILIAVIEMMLLFSRKCNGNGNAVEKCFFFFQEHLRRRMSRTPKPLLPSNVASDLIPETPRLLWHSQSATPTSPTRYDAMNPYPVALDVANKYVVTVSHPTWLTMFWQAQACGALADWLRHQPEYSSLAPKALENFNLASSFMSKVKV